MNMTPATKQLDQAKIDYQVHEYEHDSAAASFGLEAADKLQLDPETVYKTLLVTDGKGLFVAVLPVVNQLDLKKMAKALSVKKLQMADPKVAGTKTGYVMGGVSPIGQKVKLPTLIHISAQNQEEMYVSGGRRGLDVGIKPQDLAKLLKASFVDIV